MSTRHGSISQQALKRFQGGELILKGYDNEEFTDIVEACPCTVKHWRHTLNEHNGNLSALVRKKGSSKTSNLQDEQK